MTKITHVKKTLHYIVNTKKMQIKATIMLAAPSPAFHAISIKHD